jgi:tetratricopeptide (TPR) repeat protein
MVSFGIFWFFLTLSVESSVIPIFGVIYEHRLYLPSIGVFIAIVMSLFIMGENLRKRWKEMVRVVMAVLFIVVFALSGATYARNTIWKSRVSIWEDAIKKSPENAVAYTNLGLAYKSEGMTEKAIEQYEIAIRLNPGIPEVHNNLGVAYMSKDFIEQAIEQYQIAIKLKPSYAKAYFNLGNAFKAQGLLEKAREHHQKAIELSLKKR